MLFNEENLTELLDLEPEEIAKYCGDYLDGDTLTDHFERDEPFSRKECCQYLGIGESTMTGWLKEDRIPAMAKAAFMLPLIHRVLVNEIHRLRKEAAHPRILKNGDRYQIVAFEEDEYGEAIGHVAADDISSLKTARKLIAGLWALHLLGEANKGAVQFAINSSEFGDHPAFDEEVMKLRRDINMCLLYAKNHEEWSKLTKNMKKLDFYNTKEGRKASAEELKKVLEGISLEPNKNDTQDEQSAKASEEVQNEH